jgi:hypothetical protein
MRVAITAFMTAAFVTSPVAYQRASEPASPLVLAANAPRQPDATQKKFCDCGTTARTERYRELQRPSTLRERAETSRLNREFLESARAAARANAPPPVPDAAQLAYEAQMKNYRALTESYERRMRAYNELHARGEARADPWHGYSRSGDNGY